MLLAKWHSEACLWYVSRAGLRVPAYLHVSLRAQQPVAFRLFVLAYPNRFTLADAGDAATSALTDALRDQHAAEQAQRAVEEALSIQVSRVASLEAALSEQATHAEAAAQRERMLESQLGAQVRILYSRKARTTWAVLRCCVERLWPEASGAALHQVPTQAAGDKHWNHVEVAMRELILLGVVAT